MKCKLPVLVLLCCVLLTGCSEKPSFAEPAATELIRQEAPPATQAIRQETAATELEQVEITLPTSITLEPQADGYDILQDGQIVGGLVKTSLMQAGLNLSEGAPETLEAYLQSYVEPPLILEYMMSSGIDNVWVEVSLIAYNLETKTAHEDKHYIFRWNDIYWDLWFNPDFIDHEVQNTVLAEMGLYTSAE